MSEGATAIRPSVQEPPVIKVTNPATLTKIAEVSTTDEAGVRAAVVRARSAQRRWRNMSFTARGQALKRYRDVLIDNKDHVADIITSETGKPRMEAYGGELMYVCDAIGFWAKNAAKFLADQRLYPHLLKTKRVYSTYKPLEVVGIIGPWNFPFILTIGEALPALMAGAAVVIKPSEVTPRSAMVGAQLATEAGLPTGLLQTVPGFGTTGSHLVDCVDMICFTGSTATGKQVATRAAARLIPASLELGGKDPMIVLRDADLERAANGCAWGGLLNAGQVCMSVERVYVEEAVYEPFVKLLVEKVKQVRQGASDQEVEVGSMTFPTRLATVTRHVNDAVSQGATIRTGGKPNHRLGGLFFEPTVLTDVTQYMDVMREETFGPVLPVMKVSDAEEAIRLANDSPYGLTASVWSKNKEKARVLARRIQAGAVCINDHMVNYAITEAPMGGVSQRQRIGSPSRGRGHSEVLRPANPRHRPAGYEDRTELVSVDRA